MSILSNLESIKTRISELFNKPKRNAQDWDDLYDCYDTWAAHARIEHIPIEDYCQHTQHELIKRCYKCKKEL